MGIVNKYKVNELARDFGMQTKQIIEILGKRFSTQKKSGQNLDEQELNFVFEYLTQNHQVSDIKTIYADTAPAEKPPAPAEKPAAPEPESTPEPDPEPAPAPADPKTVAQGLVGHPVSELYAAIGRPISSDYAPSCLVENGEDGELVYEGFVVYTEKGPDFETVYAVM